MERNGEGDHSRSLRLGGASEVLCGSSTSDEYDRKGTTGPYVDFLQVVIMSLIAKGSEIGCGFSTGNPNRYSFCSPLKSIKSQISYRATEQIFPPIANEL